MAISYFVFWKGELSLIIEEVLSSEISALFPTLTGPPHQNSGEELQARMHPFKAPRIVYIEDHTIHLPQSEPH